MTGDRKDNHNSAEMLFDREFGTTFYSCCFSKKRFEYIIRCIRFDDFDKRPPPPTVENPIEGDRFFLIREVWEVVIGNCHRNYISGPVVTVDEQLQGFRGKCKFRMYIANKPNKYGIKVIIIISISIFFIHKLHLIHNTNNFSGNPYKTYLDCIIYF